MANKIIIIGCGAQARYIINTVSMNNGPEIAGMIDTMDNPAIWGKMIDEVHVLGNMDMLDEHPPSDELLLITAISNVVMKRHVVDQLTAKGYTFFSAVHPSACIARHVQIGNGTIMNAHVTIETGTRIGDHVILHAGCVIEHDNILGDFTNLGPGVITAGRVHIKQGAVIYTGASIIPDVVIGENAVVGAGAVVTRSVPPDTTVVGVPAKPIHNP